MKKFLYTSMALFLLTGCLPTEEETENEQSLEEVDTNSVSESLLEKLNVPWSIAKKDSIFYMSERNGRIVEFDSDQNEQTPQAIQLTRDVHVEGEGGLLGLTLAPNFENTKQAFAYHTYLEDNKVKNRVIIIELEKDRWIEKSVLLDNIPGARFHNGGRVKIGPDQKLYITTGDSLNPDLAQNTNSLAGKILRMELDGSIPTDNPIEGSYVYSYGHRNPQGLTWDEAGRLYSTEHGQSAHDEINRIDPGKNYGWPVIEGDEQKEGMETPLYHTGEETWAPSGIAYRAGQLYIATLSGAAVKVFELESGEIQNVLKGTGRMRDVLIDQNELFTISNNRDGRGNPSEEDDQLYKLNLTAQ